jgi:hypothetical protein
MEFLEELHILWDGFMAKLRNLDNFLVKKTEYLLKSKIKLNSFNLS